MLPIQRMTLYKHGLGFFERVGVFNGTNLRLEFPARAMNDVLKSLVALSNGGQVLGLAFETPPDRNPNARGQRLELDAARSLRDLCESLRGCEVECHSSSGGQRGILLGLEESDNWTETRLLLFQDGQLQVIKLVEIERMTLLDPTSRSDVEVFLRHARSDEERQSAVLQLSDHNHELTVSYIAPAPAWRVSYRLIAAPLDDSDNKNSNERELLLQGWGLFDNTLEEDLENIELILMAGMPVSFRYALHEPNTPTRPLVADENRTVSAPIEFGVVSDSGVGLEMEMEIDQSTLTGGSRAMPVMAKMAMAPAAAGYAASVAPAPMRQQISAQNIQQSTSSAASGEERGAMFAYSIETPVSVGRGQSAMVPILSQSLKGRRECLYNAAKMPQHPVVSLRFRNLTGLTLERGPVTVLESGDYAGEAVIAFSPNKAEVIVPFAVELGLKVREESSQRQQLFRLAVSNGNMYAEEYWYITKTYEIDSRIDQKTQVIVEHQRHSGYEFFESQEPVESSLEQARFVVDCPPRSQSRLVVTERISRSRSEYLASFSQDLLREHLRAHHLDAKTFEGLRKVLEHYGQQQSLQQKLNEASGERKNHYNRQKQLRENLTPLGNSGEEGKLRARFVAELSKSEDALAQLDKREDDLRRQIAALDDTMKTLMQTLG
jgi:hypothetical protein